MNYKEPKLFYNSVNNTKGNEVLGVITNYKPPVPVLDTKGNKVLLGYTHFQDNIKSDTNIKFSIVFNIETIADINNFKEFRSRYDEYFFFEDEFGTIFRGKFQGSYDIDMPIEGEIYYIGLEMLCGHDVGGYK